MRSSDSKELFNLYGLTFQNTYFTFENFEDPGKAYKDAVETYTRRNLHNPNDILKAFTGISNFLGLLMESKMNFGMPITAIPVILCWRLDAEGRQFEGRRKGFPSWSWCGWKAAVTIPPPKSIELPWVLLGVEFKTNITHDYFHVAFTTIVVDFMVRFKTFQLEDPPINEIPIFDRLGHKCGMVQIPESYYHLPPSVQEFIIITSESLIPGTPDTISALQEEAKSYNHSVKAVIENFQVIKYILGLETSSPFYFIILV